MTATVPSMSVGEKLRFWLRETRPFSLPASIVPVLVGTANAAREDFDPLIFILALAGSIFIQAGTNAANDYYDNRRGSGSELSMGSRAAQASGAITQTQVLAFAILLFVAGSLCGLAIVGLVGLPVLWIGLGSVAGGFFYTAPPLSLTYRGLGETAVFLYMGVLMVVASSYIQLEAWDARAFLLAMPVGLLVTAILHVNNLRDMDEDRAHGKATWVTITGRRWGRVEYLAMIGGAFVAVVALVAIRQLPATALVVALALPDAVRLCRTILGETERMPLNLALRGTARLHLRFGVLLTAGLLAGLYWDR